MAEVIIVPDATEGGRVAAGLIATLVQANPRAVLGLATGSTPLTTWEALEPLALDLTAIQAFALDEYIGLPVGHPESYRSVITREVVERLGMTPELVHVPSYDGDPETAGEKYEAAIRAAGGVDLQILGIGRTGHIGFNEPGSSLASLTRVKALTRMTREDNARFFPSIDDVPVHCITQGLGTILRARRLVLLAFGSSKASALAKSVEGPVSSGHPGSVIQLHPDVVVIADEAAASELEHAEYYRFAWENHFNVG